MIIAPLRDVALVDREGGLPAFSARNDTEADTADVQGFHCASEDCSMYEGGPTMLRVELKPDTDAPVLDANTHPDDMEAALADIEAEHGSRAAHVPGWQWRDAHGQTGDMNKGAAQSAWRRTVERCADNEAAR